ncbi:MAG TPA: hypothetical protein VM010_08350, partial [Chitinophagaceae bacterium]|nr:hypothetical protein [Chitinophagaceae bacterium]
FDATDVVTNTMGGIMGFLLFKALEKGLNNTAKAHKWINILATIGTAAMLVLLLLLKMNKLPIRYQ